MFVLFPTKIIGKKYVKKLKKTAVITSCNHQSNADAIILKTRVNTAYKMMAKDSLFKSKFFGWYMTKLGAYPVKRGQNDLGVVRKTLGYLKANKHLAIFPEGTRVKEGETAELKNGLVMFALKSDCYVIPAIFRKKPKVLSFNRLLIGQPFKFSEMEEFKDKKVDKELMDKASEVLSSKMQYLKEVNIKEYKKLIKEDLKNK
jgi:1-acyl-sn-glycerol-3-phosphate acyltransferase